MNRNLENLAADLKRIAYLIYDDRVRLAQNMIGSCKENYMDGIKEVGCYENIWDEVRKIERLEGGKLKASERALTASIILLNNSK